MKYMGSKRSMLKNGLGLLLRQQIQSADRFVDLFTGAGFIAWHIAENTDKPVLAVDIQTYAATLARAIVGRIKLLDPLTLQENWLQSVIDAKNSSSLWLEASQLAQDVSGIKEWVEKARELCKTPSEIGPIWGAYGGHYFSPSQALTFDYLVSLLPIQEPERTVCLAACISAASECVASPGHTAQPFQPTESSAPFISNAWQRDPVAYCKKALDNLCSRHAQVMGDTIVNDAFSVAKTLKETDLVFIDPPYSSVQYSRFYHVLEVIARCQKQISVSGIGRYPPIEERPQSHFSNLSQSKKAVEELFQALAQRGCKLIFTFPSGDASNGLSGELIKDLASKWFSVEDHSTIEGQFSTLGGNNTKRDARKKSSELILLMKPK